MNIIDIEGTDNIHTILLIAPACEVCNCSLEQEDQDYYVHVGGAPEGDWPTMHYDCGEKVYGPKG